MGSCRKEAQSWFPGGPTDLCRRPASAFSLPGSFLNVIWDKQVMSLFCFSSVQQRMLQFHERTQCNWRQPDQEWEGAKKGQCQPRVVSRQSTITEATGTNQLFSQKKSGKSPSEELCWGYRSKQLQWVGGHKQTPQVISGIVRQSSHSILDTPLLRKYRRWLWSFLYSYEVHIIHSGWRKCNGNWNIKKEDFGGLKGCPGDVFTSHSWTLWS